MDKDSGSSCAGIDLMSYYARPEKQLLVKCTFNRTKRKISFKSARNCTYDLLRSKVEECFSLGESYTISYTDDDKETSNILTEDDLSEAISFFNDGTGNDDVPLSSNSSNYSGRSTGSRRITMHLEVNIDYDGRLSDTASLDDYRDDSESQPSFSFGSVRREFDDDDVTVSSRDYIVSSQVPNGRHAAEHETRSLHLSSSSWMSVEREQGAEPEGSPSGTQRAPDAAPQLPDAPDVDDVQEEQEGDWSSINFEPPAVNARHAAWLREQSSLNNLANIGNIQSKSRATDTVSQVDSEPIGGSFSLEKDTRGRYYYEYTPAVSHHDPQEYDQYREPSLPDEQDIHRRPSSMQLAWLASQRRVIPEDWGSLDYVSSISLEEHSHGDQDYELFLPQIATSAPPKVVTDCSHCGLLLETMRYVCSTCGPKSPGAPNSNSSSLSSLTLHDPLTPPQHDFYLSPASSRTIVSSSVSLSSPDRNRPLPPLPISNAGGTSTIRSSGYELCAECVQSYGVRHAIDSGLDRDSSPLSSASTSTAVQGWHRSAPQKGKLRHAFREQIWESSRWIDLQQDDSTVRVCSMCGNETDKKRYKCAVCNKPEIYMCQSCYSQVHDLHPNHAFIVVPDVDVSMSFRVHPHQEEQPLLHRGVNCMNCRQEIVGARFHCPFCGVDICQYCEAAGLPGNLDPSDGGHDSTHIMLKIPYNMDAEKVNRLSNIARRIDPSETATVGRTVLPSASANPSTSRVDISASLGVNPLDRVDHQISCNCCRQMIVGVRYQCANCPSLPTSFNLCQICEERSHEIHNPNHVFFRLPRLVDRPLESPAPFLSIMYSTPAGPVEEPFLTDEPKGYLQKLVHKPAVCDCCVEQIKGEWFRCVYCCRDLCHNCLQVDTHDESHFFIVFKSKVNMQTFKQHMMIDEQDVRPPIIPYDVYGKLI